MGSEVGELDRGRNKFRRGLTEALLEFARAHFALSKPDEKTGKTRLRLLTEIREQTGIVAPELEALPELPDETAHIWQWFVDLSSARSAGFSINAISWTDIWSFFALKRIQPDPWEVQTLRAIDDAFIFSRIDKASGATADAKSLKQQMTGNAGKRAATR